MELLKFKRMWGLLLLVPFLLANKDCHRSVTWPKEGAKMYAAWEADHADLTRTSKCGECHDDGRSIKTPPKTPNHHDEAWKREHGKYAQFKFGFKNESACVLCHKESYCVSCHQQEQPRDHNLFWKQRGHGVSVGLNRSRCESCHTSVDFCERCHSQTKPVDHNTALWGGSKDTHCNNCHLPLTSMSSQRCETCHAGTPSHDRAPAPPAAPFHVSGVDCRSCHTGALLQHTDSGISCETCHNF